MQISGRDHLEDLWVSTVWNLCHKKKRQSNPLIKIEPGFDSLIWKTVVFFYLFVVRRSGWGQFVSKEIYLEWIRSKFLISVLFPPKTFEKFVQKTGQRDKNIFVKFVKFNIVKFKFVKFKLLNSCNNQQFILFSQYLWLVIFQSQTTLFLSLYLSSNDNLSL